MRTLPRTVTTAILMMVATFSAHPNESDSSVESRTLTADCGANALYYFLHLNNVKISMDHLVELLPTRTRDGYSMKDLRHAAQAAGLDCAGFVAEPGKAGGIPRKTALVFMKNDGHGHYIAIRPVGHTDRLIQVFDGLSIPVVVDEQDLLDSGQWTGLALVAASSSVPWIWLGVAALGPAIVATSAFVIRHRTGNPHHQASASLPL